jgi:short subunit dehydrogenase-like uncharacterized protein
MSDRDFDVVVFGATSVTGRRVAAYLAERAAENGVSWAAGVRDAGKAKDVLAEVGVTDAEVLVADVSDPDSLRAMAARAKAVVNLVGPYTLYGRPVIEACVGAGTHYADLTGEIPFVRRIQAEFHDAATDAGVKVVQVCGFEALPPDLGVLLAAEAAQERWDEALTDVDLELRTLRVPTPPRPSDYVSGGTFQSLAAAAGDADSACIADPGCLVDDQRFADAVKRISPISVAPRRGTKGSVVAPMSPAAFINPAVIHRSAALRAGDAIGDAQPFAYREGVAIDGPGLTLPLRFAAAGAMGGTQAVVGRIARARPSVGDSASKFLSRALPSSGAGPKPDRLEPWRWRMDIRARTTGGNEAHVEIDAEGHPGYLTTAKMLGEAGVLMAEDGATPDTAGCITPSVALGSASAPRFARADLRFSVAS